MKFFLIIFLILFYFFCGLILTNLISYRLFYDFDLYRNLTKRKQNYFKLVMLIFWPIFSIIYLIGACFVLAYFVIQELLEDTFDIYI